MLCHGTVPWLSATSPEVDVPSSSSFCSYKWSWRPVAILFPSQDHVCGFFRHALRPHFLHSTCMPAPLFGTPSSFNRHPSSESAELVLPLWLQEHSFFGFLPRTELSSWLFLASGVSLLFYTCPHPHALFPFSPIATRSLLACLNFYTLMSLFQIFPVELCNALSCSSGLQGMLKAKCFPFSLYSQRCPVLFCHFQMD